MVPSVLILIMLPPGAPLEASATSLVRTALLNKEVAVSAPFPALSATENAAPTRMSELPYPIIAFLRLTVPTGLQLSASKGSKNDAKKPHVLSQDRRSSES